MAHLAPIMPSLFPALKMPVAMTASSTPRTVSRTVYACNRSKSFADLTSPESSSRRSDHRRYSPVEKLYRHSRTINKATIDDELARRPAPGLASPRGLLTCGTERAQHVLDLDPVDADNPIRVEPLETRSNRFASFRLKVSEELSCLKGLSRLLSRTKRRNECA